MAMKLRGLYAVTPDATLDFSKIEDALKGGAVLLQYRRKQRSVEEAREVVALGRRLGVPVIVNDDVELAVELDAAGAHLGRDDGSLSSARNRLRGKILGVSCYNDPARAKAAVAAGADYVAFGSVFASPTKPGAVRAPLSLFAEKRGVPLCAIGGITIDNAPAVIAAGADLLAVVSDLFEAPDIRSRAAQYKRLFA
jgi:thiamine-phosphate pyrophosphorylase